LASFKTSYSLQIRKGKFGQNQTHDCENLWYNCKLKMWNKQSFSFQVLDEFFENNPSTNACSSGPLSKTRDLYPDAQKLIGKLNHFTG
jgi:hypothetical protein